MLFRARCLLVLTVMAFAVAPGAAFAHEAEVVPSVSDAEIRLPVGEAVKAPLRFGFVVLGGLPDDALVSFRTAPEDGGWSEWLTEDEAPEDGMTEGAWVGDARWLEVRDDIPGVDVVTAHLVDTTGLSHGLWQRGVDALRSAWRGTPAEAAVAPALDRPPLVSRAQWGAPSQGPGPQGVRYTRTVHSAVVHHTAMSNDYAPHEAPGVVRAIHHIHTNLRGWGDIGYNALVDRYGVVYEGRAGGLSRAVVGAHAGGFNQFTFGISVLGSYDHATPPPEAMEAVAQMIAWKFRLHGVDPGGQSWLRSNGSTLYPKDHLVLLPTIFGHRNVSVTACPGDAFFNALPVLRQRVVELVGDYFDVATSGHADGIQTLLEMGVISGCGPRAFCPKAIVNRGQFATMLARALQLSDPGLGDAFGDIAGSAHRGAVNALAEAGVVEPGETFGPGQELRRGQMAALVVRAFDGVRPLELQGRRLFTDIVGHPHAPSIDGLAALGMMNGCSEKEFCPNAAVTRGQAATVLARVLGLSEPAAVFQA